MTVTISTARSLFFFIGIPLIGSLQSFARAADNAGHRVITYGEADAHAGVIVSKMQLAEKLELIGGYRDYYIKGFPRYGIPEVYLSDGTGGLNIRRVVDPINKSTAFPAPIALASTWNLGLAFEYAKSIGEECRVCGTALLLGPGVNIYRISQNGRNFEYFGEDPFLASQIVRSYVRGVLSTGVQPTLKHFVANNTEFHRHRSNSIVDERTLHEIYLPAFKSGIDAGALAVMTGYNQFAGEWCAESREVVTDILRNQLGFKGLVMSDWGATESAEKFIKSGSDLEMPSGLRVKKDAQRLLQDGRVAEADINRMAKNIIRSEMMMELFTLPLKDRTLINRYQEHESVARRTEAEGTVLLKNSGVLPISSDGNESILLIGPAAEKILRGGGSSEVEGFNAITLREALTKIYGKRLIFAAQPTERQLAEAGFVLVDIGTADDEGWDHAFDLPKEEETLARRAVRANPRTVFIVNAGSGRNLSAWNERAGAILYAWYPGQAGNLALADIIAGTVNPSGKLPITIEKHFEDSPGFGYLPKGSQLYTGWAGDADTSFPVYDVNYTEGVFVGYRWYDAKQIKPLYAFGHGMSYTTFEYSRLTVLKTGDALHVTFVVKNTGARMGAEVAQVYIHQNRPSIIRPEKELRQFAKIDLRPGEGGTVSVEVPVDDLGYWDINRHAFRTEAGQYQVCVGAASDDIRLSQQIDVN